MKSVPFNPTTLLAFICYSLVCAGVCCKAPITDILLLKETNLIWWKLGLDAVDSEPLRCLPASQTPTRLSDFALLPSQVSTVDQTTPICLINPPLDFDF